MRSAFARRIVLVLTIGCVIASSARPTAGEASVDVRAHRTRLDEIQQRLRVKRRELRAAAGFERMLATQVHETEGALDDARAELKRFTASAVDADARVRRERLLLDAATASLRKHVTAYRRRIVDIYEFGESNDVAALLSATSFVDFAERWDDLRFLVSADQRTVRDRMEAQARERRAALSFERAKAAALELRQRAESTQTRAQALYGERQNLLALAGRRRAADESAVETLDDLSAREERALELAIQARQQELERERTAPAIGSGVSPARGSGRFLWPVHGPITSPFGYRPNPFGGAPDFHPGLDIAAPNGTSIVAADSGRIIIAGWVSGYGNYIAIDHGGGISSAYGHCSRIDVSVGQDVQRGQIIGAVGSTGHSTGPHVHFEIRVHGAPVDPAPRLP